MSLNNLLISTDIEEILQLHGRVRFKDGKVSPPVLLRIEHPRYDYTRMRCEITASGGYEGLREIQANVLAAMETGLTIQSTDNPDFECHLYTITGISGDATTVRIDAHWYECAFSSWDYYELPHEGTLHVTVELAPSKILSNWGVVELKYDGSIKRRGGDRGKLDWKCPWGNGEALERYVHEKGSLGRNQATIQIARPALFFTLKADKMPSPIKVFEHLENEIQDVCRVLSLCYRKSVGSYEVRLEVGHKDLSSAAFPLPRRRRVLFEQRDEDHVEPLIERRNLLKGGLGGLLKAFRSIQEQAVIENVVTYLVAAHANESLETRFFLCQVALEALTNYLVGQHKGWTPKPATAYDKIRTCTDYYCVSTKDLWKTEGFEKGLKSALSGRNRLFHGASVADFGALYGNLVRLRTLTERLLLAVFKWPEDRLWPHRDQTLRSLLV